jgi:hypothetical protein
MLSKRCTNEQRRRQGLILLLFLACLMFCAAPAPAVRAAELKAELVKKTMEGTTVGFLTGQVQLTFPDGHTQLLPYRSHLPPVAANGKVYIFTTNKEGEITRIVVYDSAKGRGQSLLLPEDLKRNPYFGSPSFSPDGTKVAYYFFERKSSAQPKFGFIDRTGKMVVSPQFEYGGGNFKEGLSLVKLRGKLGFIDKTGKLVIPPQFENARDFSEDLALVRQGGQWGYIDRKGKMAIEPQFDVANKFSDGLAAVSLKGTHKYGFIDKTGKQAIPPQFDSANDFSDGLARIGIGNKEGFIDRQGNMVISPRFSTVSDFSEGIAWVRNKGFIDKTGKLTLLPQTRYVYEPKKFSEGLAAAQVGEKWGFVDKTGQFAIPPRYFIARSFSEGLAAVNIGGKWGYGKSGFIDRTGNLVIPAQYDAVDSFSEGLAGVLIDGKCGFIDKTGKIIIQPQYDEVGPFSQGMAKIVVGGAGEVGARVRSWPGWQLLWRSPLCTPPATDVPPLPPLWESKSLVEFDPLFCDPPRFLKYQVPEPGKSE